MRLYGAFLCLAIFCSLVSPAQQIRTEFDPKGSLADFKNFAFAVEDRPAQDVLRTNPALEARIRTALQKELMAIGFQMVEESRADFMVSYDAYSAEWSSWHQQTFGSPSWVGPDRQQQPSYKEGTLIVEFVNKSNGQPVWRGFAVETFIPRQGKYKIENATSKLAQKLKKDISNQQKQPAQ